ncbi:MAG: hypothetical protein ACRCZS_25470 [Chroococcidiopsis sp.]
MGVKMLPERREEIKSFIAAFQDWTDSEIGKQFGVSRTAIGKYRKDMGLKNPNLIKFTPERIAEIKEFIADHQDWTGGEIGRHFGVSKEVIRKYRREMSLNRKRKFTPEYIAEIKSFIATHRDWTDSEISKHFGVSPQVVGKYRREMSLKGSNTNNFPPERIAEIKEFIANHQDWTRGEIGRHFGVSLSTIARYRKQIKNEHRG